MANGQLIIKNIRRIHMQKLIAPCLYLVLLLFLWMNSFISDVLLPKTIFTVSHLASYYSSKKYYVDISVRDLYFTGYTSSHSNAIIGYYYYTIWEDACIFLLLSPVSCENGIPYLEHITFRGRLQTDKKEYRQLIAAMAEDMNWSYAGMMPAVSPYFISEPDFVTPAKAFFIFLYALSGFYAAIHLTICLVYIGFPYTAPACRRLSRYGKAKQLLALADKELSLTVHYQDEEFFLTRNFFVILGRHSTFFIPLQVMKGLCLCTSRKCRLSITADQNFRFQCPKGLKFNLDQMIQYLKESNPSIQIF